MSYIEKDGTIKIHQRETVRIMDEFAFDCSAMADEIADLRQKVEGLEDDLRIKDGELARAQS